MERSANHGSLTRQHHGDVRNGNDSSQLCLRLRPSSQYRLSEQRPPKQHRGRQRGDLQFYPGSRAVGVGRIQSQRGQCARIRSNAQRAYQSDGCCSAIIDSNQHVCRQSVCTESVCTESVCGYSLRSGAEHITVYFVVVFHGFVVLLEYVPDEPCFGDADGFCGHGSQLDRVCFECAEFLGSHCTHDHATCLGHVSADGERIRTDGLSMT